MCSYQKKKTYALARVAGGGCGGITRKATIRGLICLPPPPITTAPLSSEISNEWFPLTSPAKNLLYLSRHKDQGKRSLISVNGGNFFPGAF